MGTPIDHGHTPSYVLPTSHHPNAMPYVGQIPLAYHAPSPDYDQNASNIRGIVGPFVISISNLHGDATQDDVKVCYIIIIISFHSLN